MTARCTTCSSYFRFRNFKGNKLSEHSCWCGGKYELVSSASPICTTGLVLPEGVKATDHFEQPYIYPVKNKKGDLFVIDETYKIYIPISKHLIS